MKYITGGYVGEEEAGGRLFQVITCVLLSTFFLLSERNHVVYLLYIPITTHSNDVFHVYVIFPSVIHAALEVVFIGAGTVDLVRVEVLML